MGLKHSQLCGLGMCKFSLFENWKWVQALHSRCAGCNRFLSMYLSSAQLPCFMPTPCWFLQHPPVGQEGLYPLHVTLSLLIWRLIFWVCEVWLLLGLNPSWCRSMKLQWFHFQQLSQASSKRHEHHWPHLAHHFFSETTSSVSALQELWKSNDSRETESCPWD